MSLGPKWEQVSTQVGRTAADCRDRYRNHIEHGTSKTTGQLYNFTIRSSLLRHWIGPWSKEEEEKLTKIVQAITAEMGSSPDQDVFWSIVSQKMDHKRSRQQCRTKW